nr:CheR family methyltransferase [Anaerophaga thermohalophila]
MYHFFEPVHFQIMTDVVLSEFVCTNKGQPFRVWNAGSSSGG